MSNDFVSSPFDAIRQYDQMGNEYWSARDLQILLGYAKWQKFEDTIQRAIKACENSGNDPEINFTRSGKPIITGKGRRQEARDYHMSRYACYLDKAQHYSRPILGYRLMWFSKILRRTDTMSEQDKKPMEEELGMLYNYDDLVRDDPVIQRLLAQSMAEGEARGTARGEARGKVQGMIEAR